MFVSIQFLFFPYTKLYLRTMLGDDPLEDVLLVPSTNISPDVEWLSNNEQKQVSR